MNTIPTALLIIAGLIVILLIVRAVAWMKQRAAERERLDAAERQKVREDYARNPPFTWERFDKKSGQWVGCDYYEAHGYTSGRLRPGFRAVYKIDSATQPTGRKD